MMNDNININVKLGEGGRKITEFIRSVKLDTSIVINIEFEKITQIEISDLVEKRNTYRNTKRRKHSGNSGIDRTKDKRYYVSRRSNKSIESSRKKE